MIVLSLAVFGILVLAFVSRSVAAAQVSSDKDGSFKLHCVDEIRENGHRIPDTLPRAVTSRFWGMPPVLLIWILSFFPREQIVRSTAFLGAVFDSIHTALVMGIAAWYFGTQTSVPAVSASLLAGFLFAITPFLVRANGPARLKLSERAIGAVFVTLSMTPVLFWYETNAIWPLSVSVLAVALVYLMSNFGAQVIWFLYLTVFLVTLEPIVLAIPIFGAVTAIILSGGWYLDGLRAHLWHLRYWIVAQFRRGCAPPINRFVLGLRHGRIDLSFNLDDLSLPRFVYKHVYLNPLVNLYHQIPLLVLCVPVLAAAATRGETPILFAWVAFGLGMNAVISLPGLRFIGEAERYGEYVVAPLAILAAQGYYTGSIGNFLPTAVNELVTFDSSVLALTLVVVSSAVLLAGNVYLLSRRFSENSSSDKDELLGFLRDLEGTHRIMMVPGFKGAYYLPQTDHEYVLYRPSCLATPNCRSLYLSVNYTHHYPYPDIQALVETYDLDYLIVLSADRSRPFEYDWPDESPTTSLSDFEVYDVSRGPISKPPNIGDGG